VKRPDTGRYIDHAGINHRVDRDSPHRAECLASHGDRAARIEEKAARVAAEVRALGLARHDKWARDLLAKADGSEGRAAG
jgi:hypothetical protein